MLEKLRTIDRSVVTIAGIAAIVVFFLSLNVLVSSQVRNARLDLTTDSRFTLSDGTRQVLTEIGEPISLRFYRSQALDLLGPFYSAHAKRVEELLDEYARLSGGRLEIERYDPQAFSPEEDLAVADGLRGVTIDTDGSQMFFGLSGRNRTDDTASIPFFAPERANFLEYDLTRLVNDLARPQKKVVALAGDLPLNGTQLTQFQPWVVVESLRQFFQVRQLSPAPDRIDDDVEILVLAQPASLTDQARYAIDQFVMRGGRVLAFVDPLSEAIATRNPQQPTQGNAIEAMAPLLEAWGVAIPDGKVVGDRQTALRVQAVHQGRQVITDFLPWLGLSADYFAKDDVVTGQLQVINLRSTGHITASEGATTSLEPLINTSDQVMELNAAQLQFQPDPVGLLNSFEPLGESLVIAARVSGPVKSAFPDGPPDSIEDEALRAAHKAEAEAPLNLILFADSDVLADENWVQRGNLLGQSYTVPSANNGDFVINALDNLSGSQGLIDLRGRGLGIRPFEVLQAMERDAEAQFRAKEQTLLQNIEAAQTQIAELQKQEAESGVLLTAEQQKTIEDFRGEMLELRRELRDVQHALRQDVEALETRIRFLNIWAVPLLIGVIALVVAFWRRRRAARFHAATAH